MSNIHNYPELISSLAAINWEKIALDCEARYRRQSRVTEAAGKIGRAHV